MGILGLKQRPQSVPLLQAAAAVGQNRLMHIYQQVFNLYHQKVGQVLLTAADLHNRRSYVNIHNTLMTLLEYNVIPIINENDSVGIEEIKPEVMIAMIPTVLKRIKKLGGKAILDCVDATRSDLPTLVKAIERGIKHGVQMVMLYDTVGACNIPAISYLIKTLRPITREIPLGIHVHDDFGLGTASTIAAVEQGATFMDLVVNKLGDRAGNTSLEEVVVALEMLYGIDTGIDLSKLYDLSKLVEKLSRVPLPPNKPVVGSNTFVHESELHVMGALKKEKYWMCFTPYKPEVVGQSEKVIFGPTTLHGDAIKIKLQQMGHDTSQKQVNKILSTLQAIFKEKNYITEIELEGIIKKTITS